MTRTGSPHPYAGTPAASGTPSWELRAADPESVQRLSRELGVSKITARVLFNRKITTVEAAREFLDAKISHVHDPFLMRDMDRAVARAVQAVGGGEKICVYGDYDVDGAVATSMMMLFFEELGADAGYYIPNRLVEGYSLNNGALDILKKRGVKLVITVDNGIMAHEAITYANEIGLDVIVTDHHKTAETLPPAAAVIDPQRTDCSYPFKGICGAGVAFKFMAALRQRLRENGFFRSRPEPNLKNYLDLLCIPTVCDVVPLVDENRYFVKEGLKHLARTQRPGLKALIRVGAAEGRPLTAYDLGFRFGPRINACGRLTDATLGVQLLTTRDPARADELARVLDRLNLERRDIEQSITREALARVERIANFGAVAGLCLYDPEWHIGVIGIVASRLVDKLGRPVFVLARAENGLVKGSGRSIPGVSLVDALRECEDCLKIYGGHEAAAGATLEENRVAEFIERFDAAVKKRLSSDPARRKIWIDDELTLDAIDRRLVDELARLEPFGMGNAKPVFAAADLKIASKRIVGENHLKLKVASGANMLEAIAFNKSENFNALTDSTGLLFGVDVNTFNDRETIQLVVKDFF